ncbi:Succinate dehydrogenase assembly factor 3 [Penicillium atrosanguineum]|uniref:Succinate dehydrogenase assembly factor 3 n=1 Tax=Penicillium atrosanguineum TaxID=1132637 RepID=A0A9W9L598_9EURO|nr:Bloom syndrome protein [Penicillium atrosanguineum]KAJ5125784.1 Succinate dehydrogenase assembly factor 3 [Penicillium atrosanguineum]KAJ5136544.1 Succinate dehydrogenase assembly factor 3 [Penicillium atrosanguineum]KAJ5292876.1 Bloom syndrome protein [Penicillium atrosanguineum]KAJ5303088.1 Succinate dehydrogenase assembly factor 3 [Penicillium atrosanguineum]
MIRPRGLAAFLLQKGISNFPSYYVISSTLRESTTATMRVAHRLLMATPASIGSKSSLTEALALLPPLQLYRRILRVHRKLDPQMRLLGDSYVRKEFQAHRTAENPLHIIGFLTEWQLYAQKLEGDNWAGDKLDEAKLNKMSDQQIGQLFELMQAIRNGGEGEEGEGEKQ